MRQNYGTDWLLSTSSLINEASRPPDHDQEQDKSPQPEAVVVTSVKLDADSKATAELDMNRIGKIVESFAAYRYIEFSILDLNVSERQGERQMQQGDEHSLRRCDDEEDETKTICILSVSERCLVEKDETNSTVLCINEIANLSDIKFSTDSK